MNWQSVKNQLTKFLKEEVEKTGLSKVVVGISGGLDSAVVAVLCKEVFGDDMQGLLMPSQYSSDASIADAKELCEKFDIKYEIVEITPMVNAYLPNMEHNRLRIGNFSARMRMSVLYDFSAAQNALVVGTSNKSELLLGYGTIFGDIACAINPIGQIYKSDEFDFARFLGIPDSILNKKPSADLWEGQSDEGELGYTYKHMDDALKEIVDKGKSKEDILKEGFEEDLIDMLQRRIKANAFKGKTPIIADIDWS